MNPYDLLMHTVRREMESAANLPAGTLDDVQPSEPVAYLPPVERIADPCPECGATLPEWEKTYATRAFNGEPWYEHDGWYRDCRECDHYEQADLSAPIEE